METELEIHQIELKYSKLSISDARSTARLTELIEIQGQQNSVFVVKSQEKYILIDGYRRILALKRLKIDTVKAVILNMSETEALFFRYRLEYSSKRTTMEEAWFIKEIMSVHGLSQEDIALKLNRSRSFVSRRLSLITVLGSKVQNCVRNGSISSQAAMKYLVPLSRANREQCEKIAENLKGKRVSVREMGQLYLAWKKGNPEQKDRLSNNPVCFLKTLSKTLLTSPQKDEKTDIQKDMNIIFAVCKRVTEKVKEKKTTIVLKNWEYVSKAFYELERVLEGNL